jgi:hypothetical protein
MEIKMNYFENIKAGATTAVLSAATALTPSTATLTPLAIASVGSAITMALIATPADAIGAGGPAGADAAGKAAEAAANAESTTSQDGPGTPSTDSVGGQPTDTDGDGEPDCDCPGDQPGSGDDNPVATNGSCVAKDGIITNVSTGRQSYLTLSGQPFSNTYYASVSIRNPGLPSCQDALKTQICSQTGASSFTMRGGTYGGSRTVQCPTGSFNTSSVVVTPQAQTGVIYDAHTYRPGNKLGRKSVARSNAPAKPKVVNTLKRATEATVSIATLALHENAFKGVSSLGFGKAVTGKTKVVDYCIPVETAAMLTGRGAPLTP